MNKIEHLYMDVGKNVRVARKKSNLTQDELAKGVGLKRTSITNIELGTQKIQLHVIYSIARLLDINLEELLPKGIYANDNRNVLPEGLTSKEKKYMYKIIKQIRIAGA